MEGGGGVSVVYSCLGFGVMSFWVAFVVANNGSALKKIIWVTAGLFSLWCINVIRISMVLLAANKHWKFPLGLDHHTWFNIVAYLFIFIMMYFYDRSFKENVNPKSSKGDMAPFHNPK
jgi:exosortase/archaeosortase family protein